MKTAQRLALAVVTLTLIGLVQAQGRAYRNLNFADSFDTVANKLFEDDAFLNGHTPVSRSLGSAKTPREWLSWGMGVNTVIGGDRYVVKFEFYDDKLYQIRFLGNPNTASYFDTDVMARRDNLVRVITGAQGAPTRTRPLHFFDMNSGYATWSHVWETNEEGVAYFIGIAESGYQYLPILSIEWTWMRELVDSTDSQSADEQIRQSQDDF